MKSPINCLLGNILQRFETIQENTLDEHYKAIQAKYVSPEIDYDEVPGKVKTPFSHRESRQIYLQETYLSYLWSFIYAVFIIHEEGIQKKMLAVTWDGNIRCDSQLLIRARELFLWSTSLIDTYSPWNEKLPNPKSHLNEEEKFYAEKVNTIFQDAVAFILFHEFAHLIFGHDKYFASPAKDPLAKNEKNYNLIELEKEADNFAFERILKEHKTYSSELAGILASAFAIISSFLIEPNTQGTNQDHHPTSDNRLFYLLQNIKIKDERHDFYIKYLATLGLHMYLEKYHLLDANKERLVFDTVDDQISDYLQKLDDFRIRQENTL